MARPRQRHTRPVSSKRYLTLRHGRRLLKALELNPHLRTVNELNDSHIYASDLRPGFQQLYSSDVPGLQGGDYIASVLQDIDTGIDWKKEESNNQPFHIQAPRFSLPDDAIYSVHPLQGHEVNNDVLPHLVFNDPSMPWERPGNFEWEKSSPVDSNRNRVPWLALFTFTADELVLTDGELKSMFDDAAESKAAAFQGGTLSTQISIDDIRKLNSDNVTGPMYKEEDMLDATAKSANLIFPKAQLFNDIFSGYDDDGNVTSTGAPDLSRHRFLAHVRKVNTEGMADAGISEEAFERDFGVLISNRSAPSIIDKATSIYVHLVAIEKLEYVRPFPVLLTAKDNPERRVGLVSLHSWIYTCLPPNSVDIKTRLQSLGDGIAQLRPALPTPPPETPPTQLRALQRIEDGYSLVRHRVITGEETVAFNRGPLVPTTIEKRMNMQSNSGASLQIMDKELGIMDISYSTAWSLGRTMALADRAYTTALTRVRQQIFGMATSESKVRVLKAYGQTSATKLELVGNLKNSLRTLGKLSCPDFISAQGVEVMHWRKPESKVVDISHHSPSISTVIGEELEKAAFLVGSTTDTSPSSTWADGSPPSYNEFNMPYSVDWILVLRFVLDLYNLIDIPAQYLVTDPSHLPQESLRFFFIDQNWVDALVDGALSLGNQIDPKEDRVRSKIKKAINRHLDTVDDKFGYKPPLPRFGFLMRSVVVAQFSDLKVEVELIEGITKPPVLLRHDILSEDTMMGFFSERPVEEALKTLTFTLPCHQQYYSMGTRFQQDKLEINYKRISTVKGVDYTTRDSLATSSWPRIGKLEGHPVVYKWGHSPEKDDIRLLLVDKLAGDVQSTLLKQWDELGFKDWYTESHPTSSMMGIQLNVAAMQLRVSLPRQIIRLPCNLLTYSEPREKPVSVSYVKVEKLAKSPFPSIKSRKHEITDLPSPHYKRVVSEEMLDSMPSTPESWSNISSPTTGPDSTRSGSIFSFVLLPLPKVTHHQHTTHSSLSEEPIFTPKALPEFTYSAHPSSSPRSKIIPLLPKRQDLIFSIIRQSDPAPADFCLKSLIITFPCNSPSSPSLMEDYSEVSAAMISNLRFNVRAVYSKDNREMQLRIIPRSRRGWVFVRDIKEMSVQLFGVRVLENGVEVEGKKVLATALPRYLYANAPSYTFKILLEPVILGSD